MTGLRQVKQCPPSSTSHISHYTGLQIPTDKWHIWIKLTICRKSSPLSFEIFTFLWRLKVKASPILSFLLKLDVWFQKSIWLKTLSHGNEILALITSHLLTIIVKVNGALNGTIKILIKYLLTVTLSLMQTVVFLLDLPHHSWQMSVLQHSDCHIHKVRNYINWLSSIYSKLNGCVSNLSSSRTNNWEIQF